MRGAAAADVLWEGDVRELLGRQTWRMTNLRCQTPKLELMFHRLPSFQMCPSMWSELSLRSANVASSFGLLRTLNWRAAEGSVARREQGSGAARALGGTPNCCHAFNTWGLIAGCIFTCGDAQVARAG